MAGIKFNDTRLSVVLSRYGSIWSVAELMGVNYKTVQRHIAGKTSCDLDTFKKYLKVILPDELREAVSEGHALAEAVIQTWRDEKEKALIEEVTHISASRDHHSRYPLYYWEGAESSVKILVPALWRTIQGLTPEVTSHGIQSLCDLRDKGISIQILIVSPESPYFEAYRDFMNKTGSLHVNGFNKESYSKKLSLMEQYLLNTTSQPKPEIKYYEFCPASSFIIVDNKRIFSVHILPHTDYKDCPSVEFVKLPNRPGIFDQFSMAFDRVWKYTNQSAPYYRDLNQ